MVWILEELLRVKDWVNNLICDTRKYGTDVYSRLRDVIVKSRSLSDWWLLDVILNKGQLKRDGDLWERNTYRCIGIRVN